MKLLVLFLLSVATSFAAEESCVGRCQNGFDKLQKCQCDTLCKYHKSCCIDYDKTCRTKVSRGDVFDIPEENLTSSASPSMAPTSSALITEPEGETCSGKSFDAFLQIKNGSVYAFRGEYIFELDEKSVMPGYPKLIKDVWGISGPIDAAFTRINCQGKSYIFKGNKYWRFEGDVLDEDYPRNISVGFENIPDDLDAAFAVPASAHHKKERVYFFKGDRYYQYEFKHQPSHEDCVRMTKSSPSVLFTHYTDLHCNDGMDDLFALIFPDISGHHKGPRFISRDWVGIKPPIDAAMVGRLYLTSVAYDSATHSLSQVQRTRGRSRGRGSKKSHSSFWDDLDFDYDERFFGAQRRKKGQKKGRGRRPSFDSVFSYDDTDYADSDLVEKKEMPVQNVYFFQKDKYYRLDLQTKRIDTMNPPYPRSIAKYWLGCKEKDLAEKR
ncbi:vitronectin b isoform X2 [Silurus meridionalis]|uniref:vitronectin b isoform X2 n=1 Tax=Silurus meridionalis TaxID=175797 RepID=UPI001EEC8B2D|nr:vitronectin b isoform X2 [Silurus meridionalis]